MKQLQLLARVRLIHLFRLVLRADTVVRLEHEESRFFEALHQAYRKRIERFFRKRVGEAAVAAELTQEVFLRAFQARRLLQPGRDFGAWLGGIARNLWIDHFRKQQRSSPEILCLASAEEATATDNPVSHLERGEIREVLRREIAKLNPLQKKAAILKFFGGWSDLEIAQTLRLSLPATKSMLFRLRRRLQGTLELQPSSG